MKKKGWFWFWIWIWTLPAFTQPYSGGAGDGWDMAVTRWPSSAIRQKNPVHEWHCVVQDDQLKCYSDVIVPYRSPMQCRLYSMDGQEVRRWNRVQWRPQMSFSVSGLPKGAYWLRVDNYQNTTSFRLLILKQ